ncbi:aminopeptidase P family protein [Methylocapsa sp. S129]|uniref:aminopeptidase P family protein n=1 Tax=Methylocapsa sp. S129 TaxID=1641869 RepID=UPI00131B298D|nr:aminopeptidase P family protein [Methylocapsa sp. S129]
MFESRFQSFARIGDPKFGGARAAALREELKRRGVDGFIIPRADEHQNEYVPASAERLLWLTGFAGSAGIAVVLMDRAAIFVDGRYTLQAPEQVDVKVFTPLHLIEEPPTGWIEKHLRRGGRLGYDPWLHTPDSVERLAHACKNAGGELVAMDSNPVDAVWEDRPASPLGAVSRHKPRFCGENSRSKIARVRAAIKSDGLVVSDAHDVAWLFNIRGADVAHTPLPLAFAIVPVKGRPTLYVDGRKLSNAVRAYLSGLADVEEPGRLIGDLQTLGAQGKRLAFDAATAPARLTQALQEAGGKTEVGATPLALMKAAKNSAELEGARAAHLRDGAAVARFLAWFDREAPKGKLSEIAAAQALETFRRETGKLKEISFPSISAAGPNSAIPHYRVSEESSLPIARGIFLIDSGGQYEDGTTDITRTIAVGRPSAEMRDRFTRVLKGHIAIARVVFPKGASGAQIDALARQALWAAGLDFDHGTGHGVGSYLSVHEGPQRIAKTGATALAPGMIISNEPGYYAAGKFGIRIENLVVVEARKIVGAERVMYGFETITLAPIDTRLIESKLLTASEIAWLDAYHARVRKALSPLVDAETRAWLKKATRSLAQAAK